MTWWERFFYGFNTTASQKEDDLNNPFTDVLKERGCHYNEKDDCWERVWVTPTKNGVDSYTESYRLMWDGPQDEPGVKRSWHVFFLDRDGTEMMAHPCRPCGMDKDCREARDLYNKNRGRQDSSIVDWSHLRDKFFTK